MKSRDWILIAIFAVLIIAIVYSRGSYEAKIPQEKESIEISVSGTNEVRTLNNPNQIVSLAVSGTNNAITITKDTDVSDLTLSGSNNVIYLCRNHSPEVIQSGVNNVVEYNDC